MFSETTVLSFKQLDLPAILSAAQSIATIGYLKQSSQQLVYLDIDNVYIYKLFSLLPDKDALIPDYFRDEAIGAHISVIYPEEGKCIDVKELNKKHRFTITGYFEATLNQTKYYVLGVESSSLFAV